MSSSRRATFLRAIAKAATGKSNWSLLLGGCCRMSVLALSLVICAGQLTDRFANVQAESAPLTAQAPPSLIVPPATSVESEPETSELSDAELAATKLALLEACSEVQIQSRVHDNNIAAVNRRIELATLELSSYLEQEYPNQRRKLADQISIAESNLRQAEEEYEFVKRLSLKGYRSQVEVEQLSGRLFQLRSCLKTAEADLRMYAEGTHPRRQMELERAVVELEAELKLTEERAQLALLRADAKFVTQAEIAKRQGVQLSAQYEQIARELHTLTQSLFSESSQQPPAASEAMVLSP